MPHCSSLFYIRIHNKSLACRESLGSVDENPIRLNRGVDAKPTPRVMQGSALGFWGTDPFQSCPKAAGSRPFAVGTGRTAGCCRGFFVERTKAAGSGARLMGAWPPS
jgi:hypothetical protein